MCLSDSKWAALTLELSGLGAFNTTWKIKGDQIESLVSDFGWVTLTQSGSLTLDVKMELSLSSATAIQSQWLRPWVSGRKWQRCGIWGHETQALREAPSPPTRSPAAACGS